MLLLVLAGGGLIHGDRAFAAPAPDPGSPAGRPVVENPHGPKIGECGLCHKAESWSPAVISPKFDHSKFGFPLEGAHAQTRCQACHASLKFAEAKPKGDCVSCHQDVHQGELGSTCGRCHTSRSFIDRSRMARAHQTTRFPLVGAHMVVDCESCHQPAPQGHLTYVNVRTDCQGCHLKDYLATTDPNHQTLGFSQDCVQCHTPLAWRAARFANHDALFFPIFSGTHNGTWNSCSTCHIAAPDYSQFSCFVGCHAHSDQASVTSAHQGVSGFVYDSNACYSCHPRGRAGGG